MSIALSILKLLLQWSPTLLEGIRKWDMEKHAREVVEAQNRAIALERLRWADEKLKESQGTLHAETDVLKKKLADLLANDPAAGDK